jgi:hypothetical protein
VKESAVEDQLQRIIDSIPWGQDCRPLILHYQSSQQEPDCRARMLVMPLKHLTARYFAYLDHDDTLYPHAYSYLLHRLRTSCKAVAFGRVYVACTDLQRNLIVRKKREFEYGFCYDQFLRLNNAPLHSFLLDSSQLKLAGLQFIAGMKYMEDYYLTLQLFRRENCDWQSLLLSRYIGDYTYQVVAGSGCGTLSLLNDEARAALTLSEEYKMSEAAIQDMRQRIVSRQIIKA